MKKRIALAAAIALAISVGGMLPASAKLGAATLTASSCAKADTTVEVKVLTGDVTVTVSGTNLVIDSTNEDNGTVDGSTTCKFAVSSVAKVVIKATADTALSPTGDGDVTFTLGTSLDYLNYGSIAFQVQADGELGFDGHLLVGTAYKPFIASVTEDAFTIGTLTGTYYAGSMAFMGGAGDDTFDGSTVATTPLTLHGNAGADTLKGGALKDTIDGGTGNDVLYGNGGDDSLDSATGDTVSPGDCPKFTNGPKAGTCKGENPAVSGADEAWGGLGNDTITSDAADTVAPGDGTDQINGYAYQLLYVDSSAAISIDLDSAGGLVKSSAGNDYFTAGHVARFIGSELGDTMVGTDTDGGDALFGGSGADVIVGLGGADLLSGNGGTDAIKGGAGNDEIYGDSGADKINGGDGNDVAFGGGGDDIIYGSVGDDVLRGQKGSDQAWGGRGTFDVCAAEVTDSCEFKK